MPGLPTTFEVLANTANEAAANVLITALDAPSRDIRDLAFTALLARRNAAAELNVLRRWPDLSLRRKQQIADRPGWLSGAIHAVLVNREDKLCAAACEAAVFTRDYDCIPHLVSAANDSANRQAAKTATTALELAEALAEELVTPRDYRVRRDPSLQRDYVLASLERAITNLAAPCRREVFEAFLSLAPRDNAALKRVLQSPMDRLFASFSELLIASTRPAIERLLLSYLDDPYAPRPVMQIIGKRCDVSFIRQLARKIGLEPTNTVRANISRIDALALAAENVALVDALRENEQAGLVNLAAMSSAPRTSALAIVDYIARHGAVSSRRTAAKVLAEFTGPAATDLTVDLLKDEDSQVRAEAIRQLRPRNIPSAIQQLLPYLESPYSAEREAARESLSEFTFERYSVNFEQMTPLARSAAGSIVRRVDPQAIRQLECELTSTTRSRRKRALELAVALDAVAALQDAIAAVAKDEDQYLRIEALRTLATIDNPRVRQLLRDAMLDTQPLVQQAAEASLAELMRRDASSTAALRDTALAPMAAAATAPPIATAEVST